jgi:transformation/transcription domain-associated protein
MTILLADTTSTKDLELKTRRLLSLVLRKWQVRDTDSSFFEKVVSMCVDEVVSNKVAGPEPTDKKAREKAKSRGPTKPSSKVSKSLSSKSSQSPIGGRDEAKQVSATLLIACLEIFTVLVSVAPTNPFLRDNVQIVKEILEPCFLQANHRDGKRMRQKLKEFLVPFVTVDLKIQGRDSVMTQHVKVLLESSITHSINAEPGASARLETLSGPDGRSDERWKKDQISLTVDNGQVGSSCSAFFSLDIISEVSKVSSSFVESFTGSLVALLERLVANHLQEIGSEERPPGVPKLGGRVAVIHNQQPIPTCGILEDICAISRTKKFALNDSKSNDKSNFGLQGVPNLSTSLKSVVSCLKLICHSDLPYCFSKNRQVLMKTLGLILDSSDNIQLLLTAVGIVGKWLVLEDRSGPLAFDERVIFLRKIVSLDNRSIPSIVAQSLADLVGTIVLAIAERGLDTIFLARTQSVELCNLSEIDSEQLYQYLDSTQTLLHRSIVACVLHTNPSIRQQALLLYRNLKGQFEDDMDATMTGSNVSCPGKTVFDMLWQLLNSDYEGVRGRMWPLVFVESLMNICLPGSGTIEATGPWLPRPWRPLFIGSTVVPAQDTLLSFFSFMAKFKGKSENGNNCVSSVMTLAHGDVNLSQQLFESLMMSAWSHLDDDDLRSLLIGPMEELLSRPYHTQCFIGSSCVLNAVHGVLRACRRLHPQPVLDPDLLVSLGGMHGATHEVIALLEQEYRVVGCCDSVLSEKIISGIRTCMQQLREQNLDLGLAQKWCKQPETNYVLSLDIHGLVAEAITGYTKLVDLSESFGTGEAFRAAAFEMDLWEDRWIHLQKEVCQMNVVAEFASANGSYDMLLDAAWKNQDWDMIENLTSSAQLISLCERGDPIVKMCEILLAITRGKLSEVENLHSQTAQLCLQRWQSLPCIASGSHRHSELLHFFHRLVEFRESGQIMVETTNHSNRRTLPDLQNLLRYAPPLFKWNVS